MTRQTIQILGDPGSGGVSASVDATEAEEILRLLGGSDGQFELGLAPEDDDDVEGHLFGAGAIVRLIVRKPGSEDDVEGHALTLHFISAEEASKFKTKVLAGGLLVGTLIAPAAGLTGGAAGTADLSENAAPQAAATTIVQDYQAGGSDLQIVIPDDGGGAGGADVQASGGSGEDNKMGSAVAWSTRADEGR
ncbi:MAG TPA: hypothetical protein VIF84_03675 [Candidatus Limnocylindrales bacterium]|jgi:hypothetical protein